MSETSCFYNMGSIQTFSSFSPDQWNNMLLHFTSYTGRQLVNWTVSVIVIVDHLDPHEERKLNFTDGQKFIQKFSDSEVCIYVL